MKLQERRPRVGYITDIPTPYRDPLLARLCGRPEFELEVIYCAASFVDRHWRLPELAFPARVLARRGFVCRGESVITYLVQPEIMGLVWRGNYDLLFVSSYVQPTSLMAIAAARIRNIPVAIVCESHARKDRSRRKAILRDPFLRGLVGGAAGGLAIGSLARDYLHHYGLSRDRIWFFPNTPDTGFFRREAARHRPHRNAVREREGTPVHAPVAIYVGRLIAIKEVHTLLTAWSRVRREHPEAVLWIVGDGIERISLERQARGAGGVRFLGHRQQDDLPALYAAADLFVLPSRDEPWGVVVNEAAAAGLPLVTSDRVGAAEDLVHAGETGFTFPAGDSAALARSLLEVIDLPDRGAALGRRAAQLVEEWGYDFAERNFIDAVATLTNTSGR